MTDNSKTQVRDIRSCNWYWIDKVVIRHYVPKVKAVGIAVYSYLASLVDNTQTCFPSQKHLAQALGYSRATVNRSIKVLERNGLISVERRGRYHRVYRLLRCKPDETQVSKGKNSGVEPGSPTNHEEVRINNNIVPANQDAPVCRPETSKGFEPRSREEVLALDLAEALDDRRNLAFYLSHSRRYPESDLRRILGEVKEIPLDRIKKSRAAIFNHLIQTYAQNKSQNPGDQSRDKISRGGRP